MKIEGFTHEYQFAEWLLVQNLMGEEARARCLDFIRWIFKTPDPEDDPEDHEPWEAEIEPRGVMGGTLALKRHHVEVEFDCEGYAEVTFWAEGAPDEMVQRYYQYRRENDL